MRFRHGRVGLPSRKANMSYDVTYSAQGKESAILVAMVALALVSLATATSSQEWSQIAMFRFQAAW
jgi:hypothetical protein